MMEGINAMADLMTIFTFFPVECKNPELYEDYDYCGTVSADECNDPDVDLRATLREYCPEQCVCRE